MDGPFCRRISEKMGSKARLIFASIGPLKMANWLMTVRDFT